MEHVDIAPEQVLPMDDIADGVQGLRIAFVNVFSISHPDGSWTLLDAGLPLGESAIRTWVEKFHSRAPNSIVLTHGHFDHIGAAKSLAEEWHVPIYAHPQEFPYLTGREEYPPPNASAGGGLMTLLSPMYPRGPVDLSPWLHPLPSGERTPSLVAELPEWQLLHTPGHTPGHVSFFRPRDKVLLVGDAFRTTKQESFFDAAITQEPELHGPPSYFTWNWDLARQSVKRLAGLRPTIVAPGHGKPLAGEDVPEALNLLALKFDEIVVPENRR
jgi:glyoxylase-like metal-dependent hydrolase (beta-lactamase superfamily II)